MAACALEEKTGKGFATRSGPFCVLPFRREIFHAGHDDTVLNIGLNDETAKGLIALTGNPRFVYDSYRRLVQMFAPGSGVRMTL